LFTVATAIRPCLVTVTWLVMSCPPEASYVRLREVLAWPGPESKTPGGRVPPGVP
jgi:hypothetical protein